MIRLSIGIRFSATLIDIGKFSTLLLERDDNLFDATFDSFVYACSAGLLRDTFEGGSHCAEVWVEHNANRLNGFRLARP